MGLSQAQINNNSEHRLCQVLSNGIFEGVIIGLDKQKFCTYLARS